VFCHLISRFVADHVAFAWPSFSMVTTSLWIISWSGMDIRKHCRSSIRAIRVEAKFN
jgi:hypothetical protein